MDKWFFEDHMVLNPGKCHYILIGNIDQPDKINLNCTEITSSYDEKLLGWLIDKKLSFDAHIKSLQKANKHQQKKKKKQEKNLVLLPELAAA